MKARRNPDVADELIAENALFTLTRACEESAPMLSLSARGGKVRDGAERMPRSTPELCPIVAMDASAQVLMFEDFDGLPLEEKLRRGNLGQAAALRILRSLAGALDEMHRRGMTHGALGLWSVLVASDWRVRLTDWAIEFPHLSREQICLLLESAAPEVLLGDPLAAGTDQFALGTVALRLLTGERAFALGTPAESLLGRLTGLWRDVDGRTVPAEEAFNRVFAPDPSRRFASCGQFVESVERQIAEAERMAQPVVASVAAVVAAVRPAKPPSRWPVHAMRIAGGFAVAAFVLGILSWQSERSLAALQATADASSKSASAALLVNGHMKVCNSSGQPVQIRQLAVGYWNPNGHLQTFATGRAERKTWSVAPDSEQNLSWTPSSTDSAGAEAWDGSVLFYFLDIEQDGKQYLLSGSWSDAVSGCLAIAPGAAHQD